MLVVEMQRILYCVSHLIDPVAPRGHFIVHRQCGGVSDMFEALSIDARSGLQTYLHLNQKLCPCVLLVCILGAGSV